MTYPSIPTTDDYDELCAGVAYWEDRLDKSINTWSFIGARYSGNNRERLLDIWADNDDSLWAAYEDWYRAAEQARERAHSTKQSESTEAGN